MMGWNHIKDMLNTPKYVKWQGEGGLRTCDYPPHPEKAFFVNQHVMWFANQEFKEKLYTYSRIWLLNTINIFRAIFFLLLLF